MKWPWDVPIRSEKTDTISYNSSIPCINQVPVKNFKSTSPFKTNNKSYKHRCIGATEKPTGKTNSQIFKFTMHVSMSILESPIWYVIIYLYDSGSSTIFFSNSPNVSPLFLSCCNNVVMHALASSHCPTRRLLCRNLYRSCFERASLPLGACLSNNKSIVSQDAAMDVPLYFKKYSTAVL